MDNFSIRNFRVSLPLSILFLSLVCFQSGVGVDHIPDVSLKGFLMHILYSINLFAMGGVELGPPVSGPLWAQLTLYVMYFLAPMVSVAAIIEAIFLSTNLKLKMTLRRGNHAIIIGAGRVGSRLPEILQRQFSDNTPIIIADKDPDLQISKSLRATTCRIDAADPELFESLAVKKAKCVFALTNNQWLNLGIYQLARQKNIKHIPFFVRMDAEDLMDELSHRWSKEDGSENTRPPVRMFNVHIQAVRFLFREDNRDKYVINGVYNEISKDADRWVQDIRSKPPHLIVLLGFGRFGQHFIKEFCRSKHQDLNQSLERVIIVSRNAENELAHYRLSKPEENAKEPKFDLSLSPKPFGHHTVQSITETNQEKNIIWILGTDDESLNMDAATWISRHFDIIGKTAKVLIRTSNRNAAVEVYHQPGDAATLLLPSYDVIGHYFESELEKMKISL